MKHNLMLGNCLERMKEEGTHILEVKKKAAEIIINAYKNGDWYFHLRDASNGEGCRECVVH